MKKHIFILILCSLGHIAASQTQALNYVKSTTYLSADENRKVTGISYSDAFGRPMQDIIENASYLGYDIVKLYTYDDMGRTDKDRLAFTHNGEDIGYVNDALNLQSSFYQNIQGGDIPFTEVEYDDSPYNRIIKGSIPGEDINSVNMTTDFVTVGGVSANIYEWKVNSMNQLVKSSLYPTNSLMKISVKDADDKYMYIYKDKNGRVIQKSQANETIITRYVYDGDGLLRYVISPEGVANMTGGLYNITDPFIKKYCFYYEYDAKHQLVTKQLPGKEPVYLRYDEKYRLRMSQDGNQRLSGKWMFINYDHFGRTISTGLGTLDGNDPNIPDTIVPPSERGISAYYTYQFYDNYAFVTDPNLFFDASTSYHQKVDRIRGKATGQKVKVMKPDAEEWLVSVVYYDKYGRVIQSIAQNNVGGYDKVNYEYNFAGELLRSKQIHTDYIKLTKYLVYTYEYDQTGRLLKVRLSQNADGSGSVVIDALNYDETGHVKQKKMHSENGTDYLQSVDYIYNIRGAMTEMNKVGNLDGDLFAMSLFYDKDPAGNNTGIEDGKISSMQWNSAKLNQINTYTFTYDQANRLSTAIHSPGNKYDMSFSYDKNGNIKTLTRKGQIITQNPPLGGTGSPTQTISYGYIDRLTYTYNGNQVTTVTDLISGNTSQLNNDFRDNGNMLPQEYTYDPNGNMTKDLNKGINLITYNHLNQPVNVEMSNNRKTVYTYTATGSNVKTVLWVDSKTSKTTEYSGAFVYEDGQLIYIIIPDGRYVVGTGKYEYNLTDQLGNIRVTFTKGSNNKAEVVQEDHYYPFGLQMSGVHIEPTGLLNKFLYNGKELQAQTGYYDYGFRQLDPQLCRWHVEDAMAEYYHSDSPYAYALNDPVNNIDALGLWSIPVYHNGVLSHTVSGTGNTLQDFTVTNAGEEEYEDESSLVGGGSDTGGMNENGGLSISFSKMSSRGRLDFYQWLFSWIHISWNPGYFEVGPVIPPEDFVKYDHRDCGTIVTDQLEKNGDRDYDYDDAWNKNLKKFEYQKILSFMYLAKGNVFRRNPGPTSDEQISRGIRYVIDQINTGHAVKAMVQYTDNGIYDDDPNTGNPCGADHCITLVGYGIDKYGFYLRFYDPGTSNTELGTNPSNRLYFINSTFTLNPDNPTAMYTDVNSFSQLTTYIITHIRYNIPEKK